jgi:hypothetical protein
LSGREVAEVRAETTPRLWAGDQLSEEVVLSQARERNLLSTEGRQAKETRKEEEE